MENAPMYRKTAATMEPVPGARPHVLAAAMLLSVVFGSLHAFSALVLPLQSQYQADRASISFAYSLAILCLTGGVFASRWVLPSLGARAAAVLCGVLGAAGLMGAARGGSLAVLWAGYGLVFGGVSGVAYSLFLDRAARALPANPGFAIGLVTAVYGGGAAICAQWEAWMVKDGSVSALLQWLALALFAACVLAAAGFGPDAPTAAEQSVPAGSGPKTPASGIGFFWVVYFLGATGGLMAIAHALPIVDALARAHDLAPLAPTLNALGNVLGCLGGGLLVDRAGPRRSLVVPVAVLATSLCVLAFTVDPALALAGLCVCGMAYGALISAIPLVLRLRFGVAGFNKAFGLVFTAWGSAGLLGPYAAGVLYDQTGGYRLGLALAAVSAAAALGLLWVAPDFFRSPNPETAPPAPPDRPRGGRFV